MQTTLPDHFTRCRPGCSRRAHCARFESALSPRLPSLQDYALMAGSPSSCSAFIGLEQARALLAQARRQPRRIHPALEQLDR